MNIMFVAVMKFTKMKSHNSLPIQGYRVPSIYMYFLGNYCDVQLFMYSLYIDYCQFEYHSYQDYQIIFGNANTTKDETYVTICHITKGVSTYSQREKYSSYGRLCTRTGDLYSHHSPS